ncbi:MAG: molybdopterin-dependent oxidoreductase, partial [Actinobacteria bacterium]|nr:molybdopterin-dependent oxidoreductase [Actinomycetota bacterium]
MTGHYCDYQNADVILTSGSNNVENHPVSAKWVQKALDKGATWIVVDPRYTRSAACADIYCPIRSGTDIAFYGGLLNYIIENDLWQHEYVTNYTNASYLLDPAFDFDVETGQFSGWNEATHKYDTTSWGYQIASTSTWDTSATGTFSWVTASGVPEFTPPVKQIPAKDMTLQDPQCVFQVFKKHYSRYDMDTVCSICGMDKETLELVYSTFAATGAPEKSGTILYALGQTQHHYGAQNCRAMSLIQLLLGNAGIAGGGVNAMRGEPNVQGATDMALLVGEFPGYLKWPTVKKHPSLREWLEHETTGDGYYTNKPKFFISALKEWWGENATEANDFGYDWLPKLGSGIDLTTISTFEHMDSGMIKGYWLWGQNPANSTPNASFARKAMAKLDWLVVADWFETESSCFWRAPDLDPAEINTTVYFLPAALIYEKSGTILNSGRWMQWRYKAVEPVGEAKPDYEICDLVWTKIVELYEEEEGICPEPILNAKWDYYVDDKVDPRAVSWALNGYKSATGELLNNFTSLKADGSTSCAIWIYSGFYNNEAEKLNPAAQPVGARSLDDPSGLGLYSGWSFAWPLNRRILYNRASADMKGKPWNPERKLVEWTGTAWDNYDVPDFGYSTTAADGTKTPIPPNNKAFMMAWEQNARLVCSTLADAPMPEHYEPFESPTDNIMNGSQNSPCIMFADYESVKRGDREQYPIAVTTYSVVEHWQTGTQTRNCPALVEAQPAQFIELSEELAAEKGIANGDMVRVFNNRGSVEVNALVTCRFKPFLINGETVHQAGMTHH